MAKRDEPLPIWRYAATALVSHNYLQASAPRSSGLFYAHQSSRISLITQATSTARIQRPTICIMRVDIAALLEVRDAPMVRPPRPWFKREQLSQYGLLQLSTRE